MGVQLRPFMAVTGLCGGWVPMPDFRSFLAVAVSLLAATPLAGVASEARRSAIVIAVESQRDSVVNIHGQKFVPSGKDGSGELRRVNGMGTGVVIDPRGYVVTTVLRPAGGRSTAASSPAGTSSRGSAGNPASRSATNSVSDAMNCSGRNERALYAAHPCQQSSPAQSHQPEGLAVPAVHASRLGASQALLRTFTGESCLTRDGQTGFPAPAARRT